MTAAPRFELNIDNGFRLQESPADLSRLPRHRCLAAVEVERREVLEGVRKAMRQKTSSPARNAACRFLLQHLSQS
jgi:hypothetical protein